MGRANRGAEELFYGEDMEADSPSPIYLQKSEWQKIESIFDALYEVPRDPETLKKDDKSTHRFIASWNAYGLWEGEGEDGIHIGIALEATNSGEPLLRATVYAEAGDQIDLSYAYEGRSLEAAAKTVASELDLSEKDILDECRGRLQKIKERIERADSFVPS